MNGDAIGLDIGGANIKAATIGGPVFSRPFELWKHPQLLGGELRNLSAHLPAQGLVAVTMTGELCDCFHTKRDGVRAILASVCQSFAEDRIRVWSTEGCFRSVAEACEAPGLVAAANWHAQATFLARTLSRKGHSGAALLVDTGSTTTDIIPIRDGRTIAVGQTDPERLRSRELVYTGARRTPVCALPIEGLAAEFFATVQDAYLLMGQAAENPADRGTADGRPATREFAHARLARMLGGDVEVTTLEETIELARKVLQSQTAMIRSAIEVVSERLPEAPDSVFISGSGEFLARLAVDDYRTRVPAASGLELHSLGEMLGPERSTAACAHAVAILAGELCP